LQVIPAGLDDGVAPGEKSCCGLGALAEANEANCGAKYIERGSGSRDGGLTHNAGGDRWCNGGADEVGGVHGGCTVSAAPSAAVRFSRGVSAGAAAIDPIRTNAGDVLDKSLASSKAASSRSCGSANSAGNPPDHGLNEEHHGSGDALAVSRALLEDRLLPRSSAGGGVWHATTSPWRSIGSG
jgi:hypothetical protein